MQEIRVSIIGKTGVGKSALGNALLHDTFKSQQKTTSVTSECGSGQRHLQLNGGDTLLKVVDTPGLFDTGNSNTATPGLFDTGNSNTAIAKEIVTCINLLSPGPHLFLFVFRIDSRLLPENVKVLEYFKKNFGGLIDKFAVVIFTGKDQLENRSEEDAMREHHAKLSTFSDVFKNRRFAMINNKDTTEGKMKGVGRILQLLQTTMQKNGGDFYKNEMYEEAKKLFEARIQNQDEVNQERLDKLEQQKQRENNLRNWKLALKQKEDGLSYTEQATTSAYQYECRTVLIGKTGQGNSCHGNNLLQGKLCGIIEHGYKRVVVDTPRLLDTQNKKTENQQDKETEMSAICSRFYSIFVTMASYTVYQPKSCILLLLLMTLSSVASEPHVKLNYAKNPVINTLRQRTDLEWKYETNHCLQSIIFTRFRNLSDPKVTVGEWTREKGFKPDPFISTILLLNLTDVKTGVGLVSLTLENPIHIDYDLKYECRIKYTESAETSSSIIELIALRPKWTNSTSEVYSRLGHSAEFLWENDYPFKSVAVIISKQKDGEQEELGFWYDGVFTPSDPLFNKVILNRTLMKNNVERIHLTLVNVSKEDFGWDYTCKLILGDGEQTSTVTRLTEREEPEPEPDLQTATATKSSVDFSTILSVVVTAIISYMNDL